jgi:hypothetical protein
MRQTPALAANRAAALMSALGHKRTWPHVRSMSALPPKADIRDAITAKYTARRYWLRILSATIGTKGTLMVVLTFEVPNF